MPGEMEIIEDPHSGKNGSHQKSAGGSRKLLQLFRLKSLRWRSKTDENSEKEKTQSPDERRDQLDRDMRNNWEQLPATLRRRKEKLSQAVLDQFTEDVAPGEDEIRPDLHNDSERQNEVIQKVSDDSSHQSSLEDIQLSAHKYSGEPLYSEQESASVKSQKISSTSSQIIVRPQIHRECSDSSLECVQNTAECLNAGPSNNVSLAPANNLEARVKSEIEVEAEVKIQTERSEEENKSNTETRRVAQIDAQLKEKLVTQPELVNTSQDSEIFTAIPSIEFVLEKSSDERNKVESCLALEKKDEASPLSKSDNCTDLNEQSSDNCDKNKNDLSQSKISETFDSKRSEKNDSENKTEFKILFLPNESYLYNSNHKDPNVFGGSETPSSSTNLKLPEKREFIQEASRINASLSYEEQQVMSLLSRAVSEDSLLIPSSPSSTSASSVSSMDERNHDSGTDINSPSPSTSSCSIETTSMVVTGATSHYENPKNSLRPVENLRDKSKEANSDEVIQTLVTSSHDICGSTDSGIEKSLGRESTVSSPSSSPISKNNGKYSKMSKHNENAKYLSLSSNSSCCFPSLSNEPALYEVVIPRAEYHKPSHIALKTVEYQAPRDKSVREVHHDMLGYSSLAEGKLVCDYKSKTQNQSAKCGTKLESLGKAEEDVMSYYDAVVQEGHTSNLKIYDDNTDTFGNCPLHLKSKKAVMDDKEYDYVAKGLYINDYIHDEIKNQKSVCNERSENGHVGKGNAFTKPYAAMEFAGNCIDLNKEKEFTNDATDCKDKICLQDIFGSKWKRPLGLETLNKKPLAMATIMEEKEGEADTNASTVNTSDSEKLTVREILRRFEELGGRVQLPTDITQVEGDNDAEKSATLREIQETLRCLEEKVRHYETKAATTQTQDADETSSDEKVEHAYSFITLMGASHKPSSR
jgi:hypothetical protein